jgi:rare lipoprotein A
MQTKLRAILLTVGLLLASTMLAATHNKTKAQKLIPMKELGTASWYGKERQGKRMANGERFDRNRLTAACWFFEFGQTIKVVNLKNGKEVTVTITDRGPNSRLKGRIIDLSEAAARELDYTADGLAPVMLIRQEILAEPESIYLKDTLIEPSYTKDNLGL